jgi:hypothetical protein
MFRNNPHWSTDPSIVVFVSTLASPIRSSGKIPDWNCSPSYYPGVRKNTFFSLSRSHCDHPEAQQQTLFSSSDVIPDVPVSTISYESFPDILTSTLHFPSIVKAFPVHKKKKNVKTFSNPQLPKLQMRKPRHGDD